MDKQRYERLKNTDLQHMTHRDRTDYLGALYDRVRCCRAWAKNSMTDFHIKTVEVEETHVHGNPYIPPSNVTLVMAGRDHWEALPDLDELLYEIERVLAFAMDHEKLVKASLIKKLMEN